MAYLRWSRSAWYAFLSNEGGDEDDAVLVAWHETGHRLAVRAGELRRAGCVQWPERLSNYLEPDADRAAIRDVHLLSPAVEQFLLDVYHAGKIPMPPEVAQRYRTLTAWRNAALARPFDPGAVCAPGRPLLHDWIAELEAIDCRYPPPRPSRQIRDLMDKRALRALHGETVSPKQEREERAQIEAASQWPPL